VFSLCFRSMKKCLNNFPGQHVSQTYISSKFCGQF
jgi:hypothetical protein